ncbi:hypothetical protein COY07_06310 [Candidatus Peregrinibacteria bacterium CG_4_10_14_0_2_um_filter_43_11]|nr:MAG: hypothetical protein COY07_06310 [Candidatus Peregrinibacteria bacterium CG_4_10_14_0_2_um_filter_43_11]
MVPTIFERRIRKSRFVLLTKTLRPPLQKSASVLGQLMEMLRKKMKEIVFVLMMVYFPHLKIFLLRIGISWMMV